MYADDLKPGLFVRDGRDWHPSSKPGWRAVWWVDDAPRGLTAAYTDVLNRHINYLFLPRERHSQDDLVGVLARAAGSLQHADLALDGRLFTAFRRIDTSHSIFEKLRDAAKVLFTFDGVSTWQVREFQRDVGADYLLFELRRYSTLNFVTTDSLAASTDFSFVANVALRNELIRYVQVVETAIAKEEWDTVARDCGNACDRVLLHLLLYEETKGTVLVAPKGKLNVRDWDLKDRIRELCRVGVINEGSLLHFQLEVARGLSNARHAGYADSKGIELGPFDAMGAYAALRALLQKHSKR
jgi:hypothetical protein